jgi:hypothetical protein
VTWNDHDTCRDTACISGARAGLVSFGEALPLVCSLMRRATTAAATWKPSADGRRKSEVADRGIQQSETGQQLLYRLDFLLLSLGDGFRQLDGGRVLALSDLGLCHGDGALMVPDHALEKQPLTAGAVGVSSRRIFSAVIVPWVP